MQTLDDHVQKLKGSWASLQSALQAAAKVKAQQPQMGVETSDAKGQEAAVLTSAAKVIHLRLEESLDQALLDCRAKRLKVSGALYIHDFVL